jgi:hypothetical protein
MANTLAVLSFNSVEYLLDADDACAAFALISKGRRVDYSYGKEGYVYKESTRHDTLTVRMFSEVELGKLNLEAPE